MFQFAKSHLRFCASSSRVNRQWQNPPKNPNCACLPKEQTEKPNCACLPKEQTEKNGEPSATSPITKANEIRHGHSCRTSTPYKITLNRNILLGQAFPALTSGFCCHFSMRVPLATKIIMSNLNGCLYAG